jgi:hypothetical protein
MINQSMTLFSLLNKFTVTQILAPTRVAVLREVSDKISKVPQMTNLDFGEFGCGCQMSLTKATLNMT